jgi:bifunctional non-homologous end joining protein LigD
VPLLERKERLRGLLSNTGSPLQYSDHQIGRGPEFYARACELSLDGIIPKRADAAYAPGDRGLWVKVKCLNREEFVVVGWTDPEGSRPRLGALLLAYYEPDGRLRRYCRTPHPPSTPLPSPANTRKSRAFCAWTGNYWS